jgi:hypothetical protein
MSNTIRKITTLLLAAALLTCSAACSNINGNKDSSNTPVKNESEDGKITSDSSDPAAEKETPDTPKDDSVFRISLIAFKPANILKIGEHTYYPDYLIEEDDRARSDKDHIITELTKADKELHDDVFIYSYGESETGGEYRFFGKTMMNGVIVESAEMIAPYDPAAGYVWDCDFSKYRRTDIDKTNLLPAEDLCDKVYDAAKNRKGIDLVGTYLLKADSEGTLYYEFRIGKYSNVTIDARTGEIINEFYWDGRYY